MKHEDADEARIVERARQGDADAYDLLVQRHLRRVLSVAWGIIRNSHDAEDLAQESFVRAFQNLGRFHQGEPFAPWINRIVTNLSLDLLKHRGRVHLEELGEMEADRRDDADLPATRDEIAKRVDSAMAALPDMQRVIARLSLVEELDHQTIAAMTGLSEGTVRSHLSLARKRLRELLGDLYRSAQ